MDSNNTGNLTIKTWRDPYDSGFSPTRPTSITLHPGLTVLVGCNGAGKTTLLCNIKEVAKKEGIPCYMYNNLHDGGSSALSSAFFCGDTELGVDLFSASEGEAIKINFGQIAKKFKRFLQDGFFDSRSNRLAEHFRKYGGEAVEEKELCNKRILLFDAVDSDLSVDSIVEIKSVFDLILEDARKLGIEVYLVISANEYELARNSSCFDVNEGRYIEFADYEEYRSFIIKSRQKKEKRISIDCDVQPLGNEKIYDDTGTLIQAEYQIFCDPNKNIHTHSKVIYKEKEYKISKITDWDDYYILYLKAVV